jgi:tagatose-1,6-bisphosphate aldolase non-catalytic subunit AgaZ/GatZ
VDYNNEMTTYEDQSFRRERYTRKAELLKLKDHALVLLREALYAANRSSEEMTMGDSKKVWKATYEAVIASAPEDIREIANFLRNYYGSKSKHRNTN